MIQTTLARQKNGEKMQAQEKQMPYHLKRI